MELQPEKKLSACGKEESFFANNGGAYSSLYDLKHGLEQMDEGAFGHHVNDAKNDFSNWVGDVIGDATLAQGLMHLSDKDSMHKRVALRIRFLELIRDGAAALPKKKSRRAKK
jgi:hypothetical protein